MVFFIPNLIFVEWLVRASDSRPQRLLLDAFFVLGASVVLGVVIAKIQDGLLPDVETPRARVMMP